MTRTILVLALLVSTPALAQEPGPLLASGLLHARTLAVQEEKPASALDADMKVGVLRFAEGFYLCGEVTDAVVSWILLGKDNKTEANPLLPNNRLAVVTVKVAAVAGGIYAAEQLWKDGHRWQAIAVMGAAGVLSFASAGNTVYQKYGTPR